MPNQDQSRKGIPQKDEGAQRPSADGAGEGPGKIGLNSDDQPDLVAPSGAADDTPMGGGALNFEDGDMARPYGNTTRTGGTWDEKKPSDAGELGSPGVGMSDRNGPSDPDAKRSR